MRFFSTIAILHLVFATVLGQYQDSIFTNNNPKLTNAESHWLNATFKSANFDFSNKYIGFVELQSGGFYGIGKFPLPLKKKTLSQLNTAKFDYKLIVLDTIEKMLTRGYDAFLILVRKKNKGKLKRLNIEKLIAETKNRYPQIPVDAGIDTSSILNMSNAIFFNEVYKAGLYPDTTFNFIGKRVAIFNSHCQHDKVEKVSITDYVNRIKTQLDIYGFSMTEFTYYLTDEQKRESGGYDVIIQYRCKVSLGISFLIKQLR